MENKENANQSPESKKSKATSITMPNAYWEKVSTHCKDTGLSVSDVVRRALDAYFKMSEK